MTAVAAVAATEPVMVMADAHAPERVRRELAAYAAQTGLSDDLADTAKLLASELVTNSYRAYARAGMAGACAVLIRHEGDELVVLVADKAPGVPVIRNASEAAESGRGLSLVASLSYQWSWSGWSGRKFVWFSLRLDGGQPEPDLSVWGDL